MDAFRLRDSVIHDCAECVRRFVEIREPRLRDFVQQSITDETRDCGKQRCAGRGHPHRPPPPNSPRAASCVAHPPRRSQE